MPQTVYKLYATALTDASASLDIQDDGVIEGVAMNLSVANADIQNEGYRAELSFASTSGFTSNDTRASIIGSSVVLEVVTTGGGIAGTTTFVPMEVSVKAGERLYVHLLGTGGTPSAACSMWVYVRGGPGAGRRPNFR